MKLKMLILVFATLNILHAECLTSYEKAHLKKDIESYKEMFGEGNYIECDTQVTPLEKFVCSHPDYLLMFNDYTGVDTAFWVRNLNMQYDYDKVKKNTMSFFDKEYKSKPINANHLCFDLKKWTTDMLGGESPYKMIYTARFDEINYFIQENKHGAVLTDREGYKIYMGKSCDVMDSKKQKGSWYKEDDQYIIKLGKEKMVFDFPNLNLKNYKCVQK